MNSAERYPLLAAAFGIDLRTLGLFRIVLGATLFWNLLLVLPDAGNFYSDAGITPRAWMITTDSDFRLSFYFLNGAPWFAITLLLVQAGFALMFMLGWRTRLATLMSFLMWGALVNRNILVLIGGDLLMCCLLFWCLFLPMNARYSVDAAGAANPPPQDNRHLSWGSAALLLQVMSVYFFSAILKSDPEWVPDYSAVYYTLNLDRYATPLGQWLLNFPPLMTALSFSVWWLELLGPILIFSPWLRNYLRHPIMLAFMLMHVGFILCIEIGHFPYVSLCSLTTFIGREIWDGLADQKGLQRLASQRDEWLRHIAARLPSGQAAVLPSRRLQAVAALFMGLVLAWNLATIKVLPEKTYELIGPAVRLLRIDQYWNMFAPSPLKDDGWMVIPGKLADGTELDLLQPERGAPVYDKPYQYSQTHENVRWHTFRGRLYEREFSRHREYYAKYLCRSWNRDKLGDSPLREKRLLSFSILYFVERTQPDSIAPVQRHELWQHECFSRAVTTDESDKKAKKTPPASN